MKLHSGESIKRSGLANALVSLVRYLILTFIEPDPCATLKHMKNVINIT